MLKVTNCSQLIFFVQCLSDLTFKNECYIYVCSVMCVRVLPQDCFFVSVVIRNHPELLEKPVAVCHSNNSKGTAEVSSANYPARSYGWLYAKL
jgi:hypothetical protein